MLGTLRELVVGESGARTRAAGAPALRSVPVDTGVGPEWQSPVYGEYYARSVDVYAAVRLRAEAVSRPPLHVRRTDAAGVSRWVGPEHPAQRLLDRVNGWWSRSDLLIATETHLCLWGAAFWRLGRSDGGPGMPDELWALRPDRVRVVRDPSRYVAGFVYEEQGRETALLPEEVVWFRYFNPLEEHAGFAPLAAARLTADMGLDALRFNREFFRNGAQPQDLVFRARGPVTDDQVSDFYSRIEARHTGPSRAMRPIVTGDGWDVQRLGLSQRDMEWLSGLRWSLEGVARAYGVPLPLLEDFSHATLNNVREARRMFWEKTVVPELTFLAGAINEGLMPRLGPQAQGLSVGFDLGSIEALSETETERTRRQVELVRAGIMTVAEARAERGLG